MSGIRTTSVMIADQATVLRLVYKFGKGIHIHAKERNYGGSLGLKGKNRWPASACAKDFLSKLFSKSLKVIEQFRKNNGEFCYRRNKLNSVVLSALLKVVEKFRQYKCLYHAS
jgi:hypothetical protein